MKKAYKLNHRVRIIVRQGLVVGLTIASATIIVIPIVWMVNAAIRPIREILTYPPQLIPHNITFEYLVKIILNEQYQRYFMNSAIISLSTLAISVGLALPAAYGLSRFRLRGGNAIMIGILALLMLPAITLIIPYFRLAKALLIYDTLAALIIVNTAFILPEAIWLMKGYVDSIPIELEEAAFLDGCSRFQALWRVLVPLAVPGIIGVGTFAFIAAWSEYLFAIILTDSHSSQPITIGLSLFFSQYKRDWNSIMALSALSSLPLVLIFIFFQRWVVQGMTAGAVK